MKTIEKIENEVEKFNDQHELSSNITADPSRLARHLGDEVFEEQTEFIHFSIDKEEWEITYRQTDGRWVAHLHRYESEE